MNDWKPISEAPRDGMPIQATRLVRFLPYKKNKQGQTHLGLRGRWQEWNGYGCDNINNIDEKLDLWKEASK